MKRFILLSTSVFAICTISSEGSTQSDDSWPGKQDSTPCMGQYKQKAMYTQYTFNPSLADKPIVDVTVQIRWDSLKFAPWNTGNKRTVYAAFPIGYKRTIGVGGYFGAILSGTRQGKFLFSLWDDRDKEKEHPARALSWPLSYTTTCKRNCQDCGHDKKGGLSTGTQCKVKDPDMKVGSRYEIRVKRINEHITINTKDYGGMPSSHERIGEYDKEISGGEWVATVRNMESGKVFEIGRMLFEGDGGGLTRISAFDEMVGCNKCDDVYHKDTRFGPFIHDDDGKIRTPVKITGSSNAKDIDGVCRKFGITGSRQDISTTFEQGPGTVETFKTGEKPVIW